MALTRIPYPVFQNSSCYYFIFQVSYSLLKCNRIAALNIVTDKIEHSIYGAKHEYVSRHIVGILQAPAYLIFTKHSKIGITHILKMRTESAYPKLYKLEGLALNSV